MSSYQLIIGIVPRNYAELLTNAANQAGARGASITRGRGTAANTFLQILGFGDSAKDLVYVVAPEDQVQVLSDAMINASLEKKQPFGVLFSVPVTDFIKTGINEQEESKMNESTTHKLITVIVNKGYADDAMDAARKAGATGGTILSARGTAKPGDEKFFGLEIVPEKDMILIVAENQKANDIISAIQNLPCLANPGSGIAFASPAQNFTLLGKSKKE
ncbi:MAG: P-II family nitrogen regulator [Treponema sp.]|nr:P-II family nitrogen regulator [Treponema sp.]